LGKKRRYGRDLADYGCGCGCGRECNICCLRTLGRKFQMGAIELELELGAAARIL